MKEKLFLENENKGLAKQNIDRNKVVDDKKEKQKKRKISCLF